MSDLAARINIATFEMLTLVAEFDRRDGWADNFASCAEWLAWRTGRTLAAARENVRVAHALEELPLTGAPRFVDSAVPLPLELAALEAVA